MDHYLEITQGAISWAENELAEWLEALRQHPGLESLRPNKERILRMNLEAARERLDKWAEM